MKLPRLLVAPVLVWALSQCYYAPQMSGPYAPRQQAYQSNVREYGRDIYRQAYENGARSGEADRRAGLGPDYRRYGRLFNQGTERAFADGYHLSYQQGRAPYPQPGGVPMPPATLPPTSHQAPSQAPENSTTPMYNRGYDFGMRDRAARRPRDPEAHMAGLPAWARPWFERGYLDAFNATPNR